MKKKSILVIALISILGIVFAVSCFLLVRGISQFSKAEKRVERSVTRLRNYYARNPFPSPENVKREEANGQALREWMTGLAAALREGQIEPIQKTPAQFLRLFSQKRDELKQMAARSRTRLGDDFAIGFERYSASGALPAPPDVPRLAQQLVIADQVCRIIFQGGATELTSLRREEFEAAEAVDVAAATSARGRSSRRRTTTSTRVSASGEQRPWQVSHDAGVLGTSDLSARMRFGVTFEAREDALFGIMNALAAHDMFAVVTLLKIEKTGDDVTPPAQTTAQTSGQETELAAAPSEAPPRSQRLMSGEMLEKPMRVTMEIDVYRFAALTNGKDA